MAPKRRTPASSGPATSSSQGTPAISSAGSKGTKSVASNSSSKEIVEVLWARYLSETPQRILLLDGFMAYLVILGVLQFVYCVISGNYVRYLLILLVCWFGRDYTDHCSHLTLFLLDSVLQLASLCSRLV